MNSENHLVRWDLQVTRRWDPIHFLNGGRWTPPAPFPPYNVKIDVEFDDNDSALAFEEKVREILEEMS